MDFGDYTQEQRITWGCGERGVALFMAMMFLVLLSGFSILMFENAMLEKMIAGQVTREIASLAMADSGIERVLSWFDAPAESPDSDFFEGNRCAHLQEPRPFDIDLGGGSGIMTVAVSKSDSKPNERCKIQTHTNRGKGVEVEVEQNPMPKITHAAQGLDNADTRDLTINNIVVHRLGETNGTSAPFLSAASDQRDPIELHKLKSFIKRFGRYFTATSENCLIEQGLNGSCHAFQALFSRDINTSEENAQQQEGYELVFIEASDKVEPVAIKITPGNYKGYFYFTGNILIQGGRTAGQTVAVRYASSDTGMTLEENLSNIHLDGLLYTAQGILVNNPFNIYGAIYAGKGFNWQEDCVLTGHFPCLNVWYNSVFYDADYEGVIPMIRVPGTWRAM